MDDILSKSYSQPLGRGMLYPPPPYSYRDARMMIIMFEGSRTSIEPFLPAGVQLADMTPLCILGAHFYGPYFAKEARGCHPESAVRPPILAEYEPYLRFDCITRAPVAPELPGAEAFVRR